MEWLGRETLSVGANHARGVYVAAIPDTSEARKELQGVRVNHKGGEMQ